MKFKLHNLTLQPQGKMLKRLGILLIVLAIIATLLIAAFLLTGFLTCYPIISTLLDTLLACVLTALITIGGVYISIIADNKRSEAQQLALRRPHFQITQSLPLATGNFVTSSIKLAPNGSNTRFVMCIFTNTTKNKEKDVCVVYNHKTFPIVPSKFQCLELSTSMGVETEFTIVSKNKLDEKAEQKFNYSFDGTNFIFRGGR